ncbi:MAG: outer membrane lipoprotein chaperone LolA, partial [Gammaproteobacteria bacterium]
LKTMRAQFSQQVKDSKGTIIQEVNGQMALQRPGRFRWDTQSTGQQIVADGKKVWIYDSELQQVQIQKQDMDSVKSPAVLLSGSLQKLKNTFKITELTRKEAGVWFELTPVYKDAPFQSVQLHFIKGRLENMRLSDAMGHTSYLTFSRVEMNRALSASLFKFRIPQGVDVVDQT